MARPHPITIKPESLGVRPRPCLFEMFPGNTKVQLSLRTTALKHNVISVCHMHMTLGVVEGNGPGLTLTEYAYIIN